jgi:transposase
MMVLVRNGLRTIATLRVFEVDETYIGGKRQGKRQGKRGRGSENKSKVVGATQRNGKIITKVIPDIKRSTLVPFLTKNVASGAVLYTDEFPSYDHMIRLVTHT